MGALNGHDHGRYARAALDAELATLAGTARGRNHAANVAGFKMGGLTIAGALNRKEVEPLLFQAAEQNGSVAKHGAEVMRRTIRSGLDAGEKQPRALPEARSNGVARPRPQPAARPQEPARPVAKLHDVPIPVWTEPDGKGRLLLFAHGLDEPKPMNGEIRRHRYIRNGVAVRAKIKKADGAWTDIYRVRRTDNVVGWQAKKPAGFVPVPYLGPAGAIDGFDPELADEPLWWAEGEKDVDSLQQIGLAAFTFGSASDVPACEELIRSRDLIIVGDHDVAGEKGIARKVEMALGVAARVRVVRFLELPAGGDVSDFIEAGGNVEQLSERAEDVVAEAAPSEPGQERFEDTDPSEPFIDPQAKSQATVKRVSLKRLDVFLAEYEPLEYALEPIVRTGSLYTLTARTGAGKTAWLLSVALALATGRREILGLDVERGRVALLTFENPDDVRMRLKVSSWFLAVDVREIVDRLLILDAKVKPEEALVELEAAAREAPLRLVLVDTLAAFFDGDNINDNVQGGGFMRRLRPITRLPGRPAVVVAAHPVKNAPQDILLPYGGSAILNEVDGNLTLWRRSEGPGGIVELHWQGKLRGLEFEAIPFRFEITTSPQVRDAKGREVSLPTMLPVVVSEADIEAREQADTDVSIALLKAMQGAPKAQQRQWADTINRPVSTVSRRLHKLKDEKLVGVAMGKWSLTHKGEEELEKWA